MRDFIEKSRSSYFKVKDPARFEQLCEKYGLEVLYGEKGIRSGKLGFIISDGGEIKGRSIHKFKKELAQILEDGEICMVRTIAYERETMEELHGRTIAIDPEGRELVVDLDDIYPLIRSVWGMESGTPEEL